MMNFSKSKKQLHGFTIIELLVVVVIIGVLASISIITYGSWRKSVTITQLKNDLSGVATAMENARTFGNSYPVSGPSAFSPSNGITLTGGSNDGGATYCVDAVSSQDSSLHYYIDSVTSTQGAQLGTCSVSHPAPVNLVAITASNTSINVSWDTVNGAISYTLQSDINPSFTSPVSITQAGRTATSSGLTQGINYYYRVEATSPGITSGWSSTANANTNVAAPTAPTIAVTLSGSDVLATITPVSCTSNTTKYAIRSHTNDNVTWTDYSAWSTTLVATQPAAEGVKYGYQAQARCYASDTLFSGSSTGSEGTPYIQPITSTPATPTVTASTPDWTTTNYSWGAVSCPSGAVGRYQYRYTISPTGYDSGWVATAGTSFSPTTSTFGYTYTVQVQAQCYNSNYPTGGPWSGTGSASYVRPNPTVQVLAVAGGGGGGYDNGGGGGGGGVVYNSSKSIAQQGYSVAIGGGGGPQANGGNSTFMDITTNGGGRGGNAVSGGANGGSGGGGGGSNGNANIPYGSNNQGSWGGQGYGNIGGEGGSRGGGSSYAAGGGGGAGTRGSSDQGDSGGNGGKQYGGQGVAFSIIGSSVCYAGGGGGGGDSYNGNGACGGGNGVQGSGVTGGNASYYGSGGGGGSGRSGQGGYGYQGIVIVSYPTGSLSASGGNSIYTSGSNTVHVFTGSGTFTVN